jgi:hypothetical protein
MKRTKNQGCGIVFKAQLSDLLKIFASSFFLFIPEMLDFAGDLLRSYRQKSSFSPFQNYSLIVESKI